MAPYSMAGLLLCAFECGSVMWSASYHLTEEASRFILSTGTRDLKEFYSRRREYSARASFSG
jgi:hypothetical protein